jgi:hypothetical protein
VNNDADLHDCLTAVRFGVSSRLAERVSIAA